MNTIIVLCLFFSVSLGQAYGQTKVGSYFSVSSENSMLSLRQGNDTLDFYYDINKSWNVASDIEGSYMFSTGYAEIESDSIFFTEVLGNMTLDSIDYSFSMYMMNEKTLIVPDSVYCFGVGDTLRIREK